MQENLDNLFKGLWVAIGPTTIITPDATYTIHHKEEGVLKQVK